MLLLRTIRIEPLGKLITAGVTGNAMHTYSKDEYVCIALLQSGAVSKMRKVVLSEQPDLFGGTLNGHEKTFQFQPYCSLTGCGSRVAGRNDVADCGDGTGFRQ
jgi:hypothetical protein